MVFKTIDYVYSLRIFFPVALTYLPYLHPINACLFVYHVDNISLPDIGEIFLKKLQFILNVSHSLTKIALHH